MSDQTVARPSTYTTNIHASSGIQTHDPSNQAAKTYDLHRAAIRTSTTYAPRAKAAPLHATKALQGRGQAPTLSRPRHYMVVSGQRHAPGKGPPVPTVQEAGWVSERSEHRRLEEKSFRFCQGSNLDRPVVQSVAKHYTD
jgi:hypothetical protein